MRQLAGTATLAWIAARRDRVVIPVCVLGVVASVASVLSSYSSYYPTVADRLRFGVTVQGNAAFAVLFGQVRGFETLGAMVAWRIGALGITIVGLISLLIVGRHTRADEERGRTELLLAQPTGRYAPIAAAVAIVAALNVAFAAGTGLVLVAMGESAAGSFALGASIGGVGIVFAAVGAVAAQLTDNARAAHGIGAAVLGVAFLLRAAGDAGDGTLTWLSPIGWGEQMRPFSGDRWWPLLLCLAATVALVALACVLQSRRDLGSGILPARPGPPRAGAALLRRVGLALRLQRGSLIGWSVGMLISGLVFGALAQNIGDLLDTSRAVADIFTQAGARDVADDYFASMLLLMALAASGFTVQSALRPRGEETSGRAEELLATGLSRVRFQGEHLVVALAGSVVVMAAGGLGLGLADATASGDWSQVPRLLGAALAQVPATWVLGGVAAALFGLLPRAVAGAWAALTACVALWFVGALLDAPDWVLHLSPYQWSPQLPAQAFDAAPVLGLTACAAALAALGLAAFARRDVG